MFGSNKAGAVILVWGLLILASVLLAPFNVLFAGVVLGALTTAGALTLVVKWSIEGMFTETTEDIEAMNEALAGNNMLAQQENEEVE